MTTGVRRTGVQDQLRTIIRRAGKVADGLDREQFNRSPAPGAWSVGQCLEHLNETARLYLPALSDAIDRGRAKGLLASPGEPDRTLLGRLVAWSQEPPVRLKFKTFEAVEPPPELDPEEVLDAFEALHEELIVRVNESGVLDRRRIRMSSVLDPRLKLGLADWYHFLAAHARRHLWQAERSRASIEERSET